MSLINDLLRDLEDRRGGNSDHHELVDGLSQAHESRSKGDVIPRHTLIVTLVLLLILVLVLFMPIDIEQYGNKPQQDRYTADAAEPEPAESTEQPDKTEVRQQAPGAPELKLDEALSASVADYIAADNSPDKTAADQSISDSAVQDKPEPDGTVSKKPDPEGAVSEESESEENVLVKGIQFRAHDEGMDARLALSQPSDYRIYRLESPARVVIEIPRAELSDLQIENMENDLIRSVRDGLHDDHLKLVFDLNEPVQIANELIEPIDDGYALSFLLRTESGEAGESLPEIADTEQIQKIATAAVHNRHMEKKPRNNSAGSLAEKRFSQGLRQYKQGNFKKSIQLLNEAIELEPDNGDARYLLASAYIQQDRTRLAMAVLSQSVELLPENVRIKKLYAQILFHIGQREQAVEVLRTSSPLINEEPGYHALLAAVLQDMKQHTEAADIYRSLVNIHPDKSVWWMGLGISLEALDKQSEALTAYEEALQRGSLSSNLRQYVSKRIQLLTDEKRT